MWLVAGCLTAWLLAMVHPDFPPPAHTGGFGEPTCQLCHFDAPLNAPEGELSVDGLVAFMPGQKTDIRVRLTHPEMELGGFQMSARYADGSLKGRQAGRFAAESDLVSVDTEQRVQYIRHTAPGSKAVSGGSLEWTFQWTAPDASPDPVVFHVAANAGNGDDSALGDFIYTLEKQIRPRGRQ
jgi:hypothetical protein